MNRRLVPTARSFTAPLPIPTAAALGAAAVVAAVALILTVLPARAADEPAVEMPVRVRAAKSGAGAGTRLVAANLVAAKRATLSTRIAANVREVHVQEGRRVAAGEVLVTLASGDIAGALAAAETGLAAAAAHEQRIRRLAAERAATQSELELSSSQRAQAEAAVAAARANLSYAVIRAPFAGTIQARRVDPGDLVGPGQPLVELEGDGLELRASLSEDEARGLAIGKRIAFVAGAAKGGEAEIVALTPGGDAVSHRRAVRARVTSAPEGLRSGTFARLEVAGVEARNGGAWVPRSAIVERGDLTGVFVARDGRAELRWISPGEAAGELVAVRAGLRPDETVIDAPGALRDGQRVEVAP
jgi:membrane fusion protein, multidrug efflux system